MARKRYPTFDKVYEIRNSRGQRYRYLRMVVAEGWPVEVRIPARLYDQLVREGVPSSGTPGHVVSG